MAKRNSRLFEVESDEDSIKTDTTQDSEWNGTGEYAVECILAEEVVKGQMHYLLKWEGYPLHRCTWETKDNITSALLLQDWHREKLAVRRGEKTAFDINDFNVAVEQYLDDLEAKKERRIKKRRKRGRPVYSPEDGEISSSEDELARPQQSPKRTKVKAEPVKRKGIAKPVTKPRRKPSAVQDENSEQSSESEEVESAPAPKPTMKSVSKSPTSKKVKTAPVSKPAKRQKSATPETIVLATSARPVKHPDVERRTSGNATAPSHGAVSNTVTAPSKGAASNTVTAPSKGGASTNVTDPSKGEVNHASDPPAAPLAANAARKSVPTTTTKPAPAPAKRRSTSNVFAGDWAEGKKVKHCPRVSGETPKDSADPKFTHLAIQNRYHKYSKNEPAPDINALTMVDPKTGNVQPPKIAPPKVGPTEIHSAYGRRTPPRVSKPRSPSPVVRPVLQQTPFASRVPVQPMLDISVGNSGSPVEALKNAFGIPLRQITCRHWQAGTCQFTTETCPRAHWQTELGSTPSVKKMVTCYYWNRDGTCRKSAEECEFAHFDTGVYAGVPGSDLPKKLTTCYYWKRDGTCRKSAEECEFAHFDTGAYAGVPGSFRRNSTAPSISAFRASESALYGNSSSPNHVFYDAPERLPLLEAIAVRSNQTAFAEPHVNDLVDTVATTANEPHESFGVEHSPKVSTTTSTDPRPAGRSLTVDEVTTSLIKDPRLRPAPIETTESAVESLDMETFEQFIHGSIEDEVKMAQKGIPKLDASRLLREKKGAIEHVYIHMPPERAGEVELLRSYFRDLNCKVYVTKPQLDIWKYFRDTFKKVSSLLIFHPSETFIRSLHGLHSFLMENGATLRVFSIGVQHQQCIREQREPAYEAQRLFPHGGITFISDDVFVYYPEKATEIIERFLKDNKEKPPGGELSKIGARPGVKDWLARLAMDKFEEQGGEGKCTDLRWVQCYEAVCNLCPMEDEDLDYPNHSVPLETSNLWSVWEDSLPSFKGRWESGDEESATQYMVEHFAGEACSKVWKYRKFLFVYQRPGMEKEMIDSQGQQVVKQDADPKGWMKKYSHIGVVTPDHALKSMRAKR